MSESNLKIEKIQKSGRIAQMVTNIVKIICIACAVITVVTGCVIIGLRNPINDELYKAIESGALNKEDILSMGNGNAVVLQNLLDDGYISEALGITVITVGVIVICMAVVLHFVSKVFKDFRESYTPFTPGILKNLKITFVLLTLFTLRSSLGIGVIVGLASWCVINIFEYGCELQKQSDETL